MPSDKFQLSRFLTAQDNSYFTALNELRSGTKQSHWIWYVFPQLRGLGQSANADFYGLSGLEEARAYLTHPVLGPRLREAAEAMLEQGSHDASTVLGELDALKFKSCLTLFSLADPSEKIFAKALERFFNGEQDTRTLKLLNASLDHGSSSTKTL